MFQLFRSRDKAVRIVLGAFLGLVGLSMVTYLIPNMGNTTDTNSDSSVVASIGKEELTAQDVTKMIQNRIRDRQLPPELLAIEVPQLVQRMISDHALAFEAGRLGIRVSEDETDNAIMDSLPAELTKGGKVDAATLNALLAQQGVSMSDVRADMNRQILISRLQQIVAAGVVVSPREILDEYHRRNDKVRLDYAIVTPAKYQAEAEPTDAEIQTYFNGHKAEFQIPEKRSLAVIVIDPNKELIPAPPDEVLRKIYISKQDTFRTPERVFARHILIKSLIKSDASNDAAAKAKAEGILKQIQAGGDFAKLAKDNSDDTSSGKMGGELGAIVKGQTVPEFEKAAFSLQPGQTSGLVKTTYGYHIIQVEKHEPAQVQPFEAVRGTLFEDYRKQLQSQKMQGLADKLVAELHKDPMHPEKAAEALGTTVIRADNLQKGDPIPGVGVSKELDEAVAPLRKGEMTAGPIVLPGDKIAVASVIDYQPPRQASLDEVKAEVKNKASAAKLQQILVEKGKELFDKTQSDGGDLNKAAKEMGIEVKTSADVKRTDNVEGLGQVSTIPDVFAKPVGAVVGPFAVVGGRGVAKLVGKTPADGSDLAAQTASIRDALRQQKIQDRTLLFEEGLKKRLQEDCSMWRRVEFWSGGCPVLRIHQDVITRLVQSYNTRS
jgi:peptidyl-prolyl cis-trans isomerase D